MTMCKNTKCKKFIYIDKNKNAGYCGFVTIVINENGECTEYKNGVKGT
jgi:uncharacterized protein YfbU (UPF0304 family)